MLKNFSGDYRFVAPLLEGFHNNKLEKLKVFLEAPRRELTVFLKKLSENSCKTNPRAPNVAVCGIINAKRSDRNCKIHYPPAIQYQ
jgi:hypothetical protein